MWSDDALGPGIDVVSDKSESVGPPRVLTDVATVPASTRIPTRVTPATLVVEIAAGF